MVDLFMVFISSVAKLYTQVRYPDGLRASIKYAEFKAFIKWEGILFIKGALDKENLIFWISQTQSKAATDIHRLRVVPWFFLRDSRASETRARVKITPREKGETRRGERAWALSVVPHFSLSPPRLAFLAWGYSHSRLRFARSTPWGELGQLVVYRFPFLDLFHWNPRRTRILCDKIRFWILRSVSGGWGERGGLKEAARS